MWKFARLARCSVTPRAEKGEGPELVAPSPQCRCVGKTPSATDSVTSARASFFPLGPFFLGAAAGEAWSRCGSLCVFGRDAIGPWPCAVVVTAVSGTAENPVAVR